MGDIFSREKRSFVMSQVKGIDTKPEIQVRKHLFAKGFRYRKNVKKLPGCPDIVLPKYNSVVFVHGCFWHGHKDCKAAKLPTTRHEFWSLKINQNILRDKESIAKLKRLGWKVIIVWQCELKNKIKALNRLNRLEIQLKRNLGSTS